MNRIFSLLSLVVLLGVCPVASFAGEDLGPALHAACLAGDLAQATALLDRGAPVDARDKWGDTPLHRSSQGHPEITQLLLQRGAQVNVIAKNGDTPIGRAAELGDLASAKLLMEAKADPTLFNQWGRTPLMLAAREGRDDLVAFLISQKVDVNFNGLSEPALFYAVWKNHGSIVKMLADAGANMNPPRPTDANQDRSHFSLISLAAGRNDIGMVDVFLAHGVDINAVGDDGNTALIGAVKLAKPPMINHLLELKADPNLQDKEGLSALMIAGVAQPPSVLQSLVDHGAKVNLQNTEGKTALIMVCQIAYEPAIRFFLEQGADVNLVDAKGETALTYAGNRGEGEIVALLKAKGATRTDLHIIPRKMPEPPLSPAQSWALAVGAIYAQTNGGNPNVLGYENSSGYAPKAQAMIRRDWAVTNRKEFLEAIQTLTSEGQRTGFREEGAKLAAVTDVEFAARCATATAADGVTMKAQRESYQRWKEKSGLAWDLCRAANLICMGYVAGYVGDSEAESLLFGVARTTQKNFTSWSEMSANFLDGRKIWAGEDSPKFQLCSQLLLNPADPNSPWNRLPWNTDLLKVGN